MVTSPPANTILWLRRASSLPFVRKLQVAVSATTRSLATTSGGDGSQLPLPRQYLRDADLRNYNPTTHQRNDARFDEFDGKPAVWSDADLEMRYRVESCLLDGGELKVQWGDGVASTYPQQWVEEQKRLVAAGNSLACTPDTAVNEVKRTPWSSMGEDDVRAPDSPISLSFRDVVHTEDGRDMAVRVLYQYGLLLLTDMPVEDGGAGVAAFASAVSGGSVKSSPNFSLLAQYRASVAEDQSNGPENPVTVLPDGTDGPLRTLYGNVWSTHSSGMAEGASVADSAYGTGGLPLHTDMTYHRDPPGLQVFTMVKQAIEGGESIFADGFAIAERLRSDHPDAFHTLCSTIRRYRCIDKETGWHLEGRGPVISAVDRGDKESSRWGPVMAIRHNDLDRLPDLPPPSIMTMDDDITRESLSDAYYAKLRYAHRHWDDLIGSDEFRLVLNLRPGDTVAVANQRCFHGRYGFRASKESPRAVMGCYVSQDDLDSRFRQAGFQLF